MKKMLLRTSYKSERVPTPCPLLCQKPLQFFVLAILCCGVAIAMIPNVYATPVYPLTEPEIQQQLIRLPGWTRQNQQLQRTFIQRNFVEAIAFVNQLVEPSEKLQHHPDILILYNRVTITLSTHDAGGLTQKDFEMAQIISQIAKSQDRETKIEDKVSSISLFLCF